MTLQNKKLFSDLAKIAEVLVEEKVTLVSLIGNNIQQTAGLGKKIFDSISDINVRMICLGASRHNFCFLVEEKFGPQCIQRLHKVFIE
jgi:aspartate kinase